MAAVAFLIDLTNYLNLPSLGVNPDSISFRNTTIDSDKAICIREDVGEARNIVIVDVAGRVIRHKKPMAAEAAIMNPDGNTIAVRAGQAMQIFNLELSKKVKSHKMDDAKPVQFWCWVSLNTIAIVTDTEVFHWSIDGDPAPVKMFDRHASLEGTQVISYAASADGSWLMVVGIKAGPVPGGPAVGCMQLYSVEKRVSQPLDGHAGCFTTTRLPGRADVAILFCFVQKKPDQASPKLNIIEVGKSSPGAPFRLAPVDLPLAPDAAADFPVAMKVSKKHDIVYIVTKLAYVYLFDVQSGSVIFRHRISAAPVFAAVLHEATGGLLCITAKAGEVLLVTINEGTIVPYISEQLRNRPLAMAIAGRLGLEGASGMYAEEFTSLVRLGDVDGAIRLATTSPGGALRNADTIRALQGMATPEGQQAPVLKYFAALMEKGKLNKAESVELARPALAQGRLQLIEKWLSEDKIECSEALGDMTVQFSPQLALSIYLKSGDAHEKVIHCFMQTGEFGKIVPYCQSKGFAPNFAGLLHSLIASGNPKAAQDMASQLVKNEGGPLIEINQVVDLFAQFNRLQECTSFLLDVLSGDKKEQGFLQTRLLEMNLIGGAPAVVDAILGHGMFHHFDKPHVARLCEKAGLFQRALELYTDLADIKRCIVNTGALSPEFITAFFGNLTTTDAIECLHELLNSNPRGNLQIVVAAATQYSAQLTPEELIKLFESHKSWEGLFYYLGAIVNTSESPLVHFKYIQAAAELKQFREVERVCRDSTVYDPLEVKMYLKDAKLPDPRPLIHVCDRFDFVEELTQYLVSNNLLKFVEVYVQKVSPQKTPAVVGKLLDLDQDEDFIKRLLDSVRQLCPVDPLVEQVESRNRLRLLQPWLEQRVAEGNTEAATHNAIGKIYITINKEPQTFLKNNKFYDPLVIGKFCEKLDPYLAYLAYRRTAGTCDDLLIDVTNRNGLFKDQARYLVERQDEALWAKVLLDENPFRQQLIDQVIGTALPETKNPDEVSSTVKAFIAAELPNFLLGLLEKLVLQGSEFSENRNLQNLLILTAIKCSNDPGAKPGRAMEYITRLDNFDGPEIAKIAVREEYQLFEEAFAIYKKCKLHEDAVDVLINLIGNLDRAFEYAERCNEPAVWSKLAKAQLDARMAKKAIDSYIKAKDPSNYRQVITVGEAEGRFEDLVKYLVMARDSLKERFIDTELVYSLAQTSTADLETFITSPNLADIQSVGDRCFDEELFEPAKLLFANIGNNAKLASTLIKLLAWREAVDAAKKANSVRTWKEVNAACVGAGEYRLAEQCGLHIIVSPDHLEELIANYEKWGVFDELISLLELGMGQENAHQGIFTELGILYAKYHPEKLMEHIKVYVKRVNVTKLLRTVELGRHWEAAAFLYVETAEFDSAVRVMIEHSPSAFNPDKFLEIIQKVRNQELFYEAINFYLEEQPLLLGRLLQVLTPKLDHARVVHQLRKTDNLPLIITYLKTVQKDNLSAVNEAVNEVLLDDEDFDGLRASVDEYDNFDQLDLAQRLERHELLEMRRIAAHLYKRNKRWEQSISLSKSDNMFKDAIDTAAQSGLQEAAESLLRFFQERQDKECFAATLYTCYTLIRPDVALELAWRARYIDYVMPFLIQFLRHSTEKLAELDARTKPKSESKEEEAAARAAIEASTMGFMPQGLQLMNEPAYAHYATADVYTAGPAGYPAGPAAYPASVPGYPGMGGVPGYPVSGIPPYMTGQPY